MKKVLIIMGLCLVFTVAIIVRTNKTTQASKNKELSLSLVSKVKSFDPAKVFDDESLLLISQSLESLYQYHYLKRPYEVIPQLADGMPLISNGGKVYTIKIKPNILYHQNSNILKVGRTVKAQDFVNQIKRIAFKGTRSLGTWLFAGKIKGFDHYRNKVGLSVKKMLEYDIEGVQAIDELTLRIELNRPEPNLLYFLAMNFVSPVPLELITELKNDLSSILVGTGPYVLESFDEKKYVFNKNYKFRKEKYPSSGDRYANTQNLLHSSTKLIPFVEKVFFHVVESDDERWSLFLAGKLDILNVPKKYLDLVSNNTEEFQKMKSDIHFQVKYFSTISSRWLGFNMKDKLVGSNLNLRKAIAHAINYDEYISILTNNTNLKANSIYNPSIPGYSPSFELPYLYDLEKAKKYIKDSGLDTKQIDLTYSTRGTQKIYEIEAQLLKKYLSKIGIKLKIEMLTFSTFLKKGRAGKLQFFTDNWIYDYPDAENAIQLLISANAPGINKSQYHSDMIDRLYEKLARTLDPDERYNVMKEVEDVVNADLPWIMMMYDSSYVLHSSKIKNFRKSFFIRNFTKYIEKF
ncbi:MAG: ABC transporter substrate-binding protein [Bacteriovoracaceae bacterium]|jgi:ABC-type transport system substrate-binding protein|nr:ABC transporter substrate-binding protein [Bacteriovoracaceae bacterium]